MPDKSVDVEFHVEDHPDPLDIEVLETQIRHEASGAMGLGEEADLAIFVRDAGGLVGSRPSGQRQARNGQPREFRAPPAA